MQLPHGLHGAALPRSLTGQLDVAAGRQALAKSRNEAVREFARTMVRDHAAVNDRALALLKKLWVAPEANATSASLTRQAEEQARRLGGPSGAAFDQAYAENEVAFHRTGNAERVPASNGGEGASITGKRRRAGGTETDMTIALDAPRSTQPAADKAVTRRGLIEIAGVTLMGTAFLGTAGCAAALGDAPSFPHADSGPVAPETVGGADIGTLGGGTKPIYVTRPGSMDPVEHSVADTLFWGDIMMEHAMFFVMLMPGPELARPRGEAEQFQRRFADRLTGLRRGRLTRGELAGFNRSTVELARTFADYKTSMQQAQESGRYRTLVWPSFFDHTRKEAERFIRRIDQVSRGDVS